MSWREAIARAVLGGKVGGPHPGGIHTYHSSPHDFDKFDWSKLRSGEGANVYGAGFYSAENPKVSGQGGEYWNSFTNRFSGPEWHAAEAMRLDKFDRAAAIDSTKAALDFHQKRYNDLPAGLKDNPRLYGAPTQASLASDRAVLDLLQSGQPIGPRTYELNLKVKPDELLDWDKPLSAQPRMLDLLQDRFVYPVKPEQTGANAYTDFVGYAYSNPGVSRDQAKTITSERLRGAGVPGIRYRDEGSRMGSGATQMLAIHGTPEKAVAAAEKAMADGVIGNPTYWNSVIQQLQNPTHNYVMFDPEKIDIMAKYALPALSTTAFGALAAQDTYGANR